MTHSVHVGSAVDAERSRFMYIVDAGVKDQRYNLERRRVHGEPFIIKLPLPMTEWRVDVLDTRLNLGRKLLDV